MNVVDVARSWIGTPYHHNASLKQVGCDCFGLIRGIYEDITGVKIYPSSEYSPSWLRDKNNKYKLKENLDSMGEQSFVCSPGDILIFGIEDFYVHCGIFAGETFIHCYEDVNKVVEMSYIDKWKRLHRATYRFTWPL
jgi:NlpC/P60 family putative phage cell wall peptidase